jgi:hypothetical protein
MGEWGGGGSGPSHYFDCNKNGHFQTSCPNPPSCYNYKKDGHRSMARPARKGLNLNICDMVCLGRLFIVSMYLKMMRKAAHLKLFLEFLLLERG